MEVSEVVSQNCTKTTGWDALRPKQREAVLELVDDRLTDEEIAKKLHITRRTLAYWKTEENFDAALLAQLADFYGRVRTRKFAVKERRIIAQNEIMEGLLQIRNERAEAWADGDEPGVASGLMSRTVRRTFHKNGDMTEETEFRPDADLLREFRSYSDLLRDEMGQKIDKIEHSGTLDFTGLMREALGRDSH